MLSRAPSQLPWAQADVMEEPDTENAVGLTVHVDMEEQEGNDGLTSMAQMRGYRGTGARKTCTLSVTRP